MQIAYSESTNFPGLPQDFTNMNATRITPLKSSGRNASGAKWLLQAAQGELPASFGR